MEEAFPIQNPFNLRKHTSRNIYSIEHTPVIIIQQYFHTSVHYTHKGIRVMVSKKLIA